MDLTQRDKWVDRVFVAPETRWWVLGEAGEGGGGGCARLVFIIVSLENVISGGYIISLVIYHNINIW